MPQPPPEDVLPVNMSVDAEPPATGPATVTQRDGDLRDSMTSPAPVPTTTWPPAAAEPPEGAADAPPLGVQVPLSSAPCTILCNQGLLSSTNAERVISFNTYAGAASDLLTIYMQHVACHAYMEHEDLACSDDLKVQRALVTCICKFG